MKKWVFLGAPSTGKTTLIMALTEKLQTNWVPEYGRDYWLEHQIDRRLSPEQLLHIAETQNRMEDELVGKANGVLLCDTSAFTTWHFALHYHGSALDELDRLARQCWQRYDLVVLCDNDIPYDDTWERSGEVNRQEFQNFIRHYLQDNGIDYVTVSGSVEQRVEQVLQHQGLLYQQVHSQTSEA